MMSPPGNEMSGIYFWSEKMDTIKMIADGPTQGGGLLVADDTLYVTDTAGNIVTVMKLTFDESDSSVTATLAGTLESANFDAPIFSALYEDSLYSVNSIFANPEVAPETFLMHSVNVTEITRKCTH